MKYKTAELTGALLDAAVAKAEGLPQFWIAPASEDGDAACVLGTHRAEDARFDWAPSTALAQGGPIIERERIHLIPIDAGEVFDGVRQDHDGWLARCPESWKNERGDTLMIAAMRAYVAHKLGEEVEL